VKKILVTGLVIAGLALVLAGCTEPVVPIPSNPEQLCDRGWEALVDGDDTTAQSNFEAALEIDPSYTNAWNGLGHVAITRDDFESAFQNFSYAKQTIGNPLDQNTTERQNLYFRFYMDAYYGSGLTFYLAGESGAEYFDMAYGEFEIACKADSEADDPDLGDYSDDEMDYEWNYVNWYVKDAEGDYALTTWHIHLYAAMAYMKADTSMNKAEAHINLCRERIGESPDFDANDWQDINNEVDRLMEMNPDPDMLTYPYGYPD
jgi:tetratricopeptide (TPR) repeat protein